MGDISLQIFDGTNLSVTGYALREFFAGKFSISYLVLLSYCHQICVVLLLFWVIIVEIRSHQFLNCVIILTFLS
jgi:hypothetical protein